MTVLWTALLSFGGLLVAAVVVSVLRDEVRGRLDRLPHALLRLAVRRLPQDVQADLAEEWEAELEAILTQSEGLPITCLVVGTRYSLGLLSAGPEVAGELTGVPPSRLPLRAWLYVGGVVILAAAVISTSPIGAPWPTVATLAALFLVCDSTSALPSVTRARVSLGYAAGLASVVLLGPAGAALVGATAVITGQPVLAPVKRLFNGAQFALCGYAAGVVFQALHDGRYQPGQPMWFGHAILPFLAALVTFVSVNLLLMAGILLISKQATWPDLLRESGQLAVGCLGYGMFGLLIAGLWEEIGAVSAVLALLPLFIARWAFALTHAQQAAHTATIAALSGQRDQGQSRQDGVMAVQTAPQRMISGAGAAPGQRAAWQSIDSRQLLLIAGAGLIVLAAVTKVAGVGLVQPETALIFGVLVALGELFIVVMPGNREVAPIASAAALGYALLADVGPGVPATHSALQVVAVAAAGMFLGSLPHIAVRRALRVDTMARWLLTISIVAFFVRPISALGLGLWAMLALMAAAVVATCLIDVCIAAMIRTEGVRGRFSVAIRDEMRAKAVALWAATGSTAMLIAVATSVIAQDALLVFTAPILVTHFAFRRYAGIRATYLQTVRALSRVTEVSGLVETGHSRRVSQLSVAMGRELGMPDEGLLELEYAALMHDIGQLSLEDPIPGGATVLAWPTEQRRIAELGAEMIKQTGVLDPVAHIVRRQADPYRAPWPPPPPLASRIIKAANAYDDLVGDSADRDRSAAVLERLRLDSAAEYDPTVVEALSRVIDRHPHL